LTRGFVLFIVVPCGNRSGAADRPAALARGTRPRRDPGGAAATAAPARTNRHGRGRRAAGARLRGTRSPCAAQCSALAGASPIIVADTSQRPPVAWCDPSAVDRRRQRRQALHSRRRSRHPSTAARARGARPRNRMEPVGLDLADTRRRARRRLPSTVPALRAQPGPVHDRRQRVRPARRERLARDQPRHDHAAWSRGPLPL